MSRTKKSRKPGTGSLGAVKDDKKKLVPATPRRLKKKNGKESGNRQKEATATTSGAQGSAQKKDPRIGNKTPIVLGNAASIIVKPAQAKAQQVKTAAVKSAKQKQNSSPIAAIRVVETTAEETLAEQLIAIEQDEKLLEILEKQDTDAPLSAEEVDYYNELMEQHEQISEKLGLDDDEEEVVTNGKADSEDDLWDKFDNSSLSEFE